MAADWASIRADYEGGASQNSLAAKHGISHQAISKRARKEGWITRLVASPVTQVATIEETDDLATVEKAIALISRRLDEEPENKDIKMLMDSLSQAYKIKILLPTTEQEQETGYDMRGFLHLCTDSELAIIKPILKAVSARQEAEAEAEAEARKIRPIR